jgi:hypothetical protein
MEHAGLSASRRVVAAFLVPLVLALNAFCWCPHAAFAAESAAAAPARHDCGHGDEAPAGLPHGGDHSPACPHCGDQMSVSVAAELLPSVPATGPTPNATAPLVSMRPVDFDRSLRAGVSRRAVVPPSVLLRKCVLLI